jgi:hypothetical protein
VQRLDIPELISADQRCNHAIGNRSQRHPAKVVVPVDGRDRRPPIGSQQPQVAGPIYGLASKKTREKTRGRIGSNRCGVTGPNRWPPVSPTISSRISYGIRLIPELCAGDRPPRCQTTVMEGCEDCKGYGRQGRETVRAEACFRRSSPVSHITPARWLCQPWTVTRPSKDRLA